MRPGGCGAGGLIAVVVVFAASSPLSAQEGGWALEWERQEGAESCPTAEQVTQAVVVQLGFDPFTEIPQRLLQGTIRREGPSYEVDLEVSDPDGQVVGSRSLSSQQDDCTEAGNAAALAIALMIDFAQIPDDPNVTEPDPEAVSDGEEATTEEDRASTDSEAIEGSADGSDPLAAAVTDEMPALPSFAVRLAGPPRGSVERADLAEELAEEPANAPDELPESLEVLAYLGANLGVGLLPSGVSAEGVIGAELRWGSVGVLLSAVVSLPSTEPVSDAASAELIVAGGDLTGCYDISWTPLRLGGCLGIRAGAILSQGTGFSVARDEAAFYLDAGLGARAAVELGARWSVAITGRAAIPVVRPLFVYQDGGIEAGLFEVSPVVGTIGLRVAYRF